MGYRIDPNDLTLDQLDEVNRLVESGRCGKVVAVAYVGIREQEPTITLEQVRRMRQADVEVVKSPEVDDASPTSGP